MTNAINHPDNDVAENYRARIYANYVQARNQPLAPITLAGLNSRAPYLRQMVQRHFPAPKTAAVLDLGCGHGAVIYFARQLGYTQVHGVDGSAEQVAAARQLGIDGVAEGDLKQVLKAQPSASLDVVIAFDVMEHFTRDELLPFVDQVHRVLKPGGRWIIHTPNAASPFFGTVRYGDITHEMAFTTTSLNQLLLSSGFASVRYFEDAPVVHGAKSALRWVIWKSFRGLMRLYSLAETGTSGGVFSQNLLAVAFKR